MNRLLFLEYQPSFNKQFCVMLAGRCVLNFCTHFNFRLNVKHSFFKCQHERKAGRTLGVILANTRRWQSFLAVISYLILKTVPFYFRDQSPLMFKCFAVTLFFINILFLKIFRCRYVYFFAFVQCFPSIFTHN